MVYARGCIVSTHCDKSFLYACLGREYFYCARLGRSQWEEPAELLGLRLGVAEGEISLVCKRCWTSCSCGYRLRCMLLFPSNGNALSSRAGASETTIASSDKRCDKGETTESVVNSASGIVPVDEGRITAIDSGTISWHFLIRRHVRWLLPHRSGLLHPLTLQEECQRPMTTTKILLLCKKPERVWMIFPLSLFP